MATTNQHFQPTSINQSIVVGLLEKEVLRQVESQIWMVLVMRHALAADGQSDEELMFGGESSANSGSKFDKP